jgi:hypothetical protein
MCGACGHRHFHRTWYGSEETGWTCGIAYKNAWNTVHASGVGLSSSSGAICAAGGLLRSVEQTDRTGARIHSVGVRSDFSSLLIVIGVLSTMGRSWPSGLAYSIVVVLLRSAVVPCSAAAPAMQLHSTQCGHSHATCRAAARVRFSWSSARKGVVCNLLAGCVSLTGPLVVAAQVHSRFFYRRDVCVLVAFLACKRVCINPTHPDSSSRAYFEYVRCAHA